MGSESRKEVGEVSPTLLGLSRLPGMHPEAERSVSLCLGTGFPGLPGELVLGIVINKQQQGAAKLGNQCLLQWGLRHCLIGCSSLRGWPVCKRLALKRELAVGSECLLPVHFVLRWRLRLLAQAGLKLTILLSRLPTDEITDMCHHHPFF